MNRFFFSDTHFHHRNIMRFCNRPFSHTNDMNEEFIKNHNEIVSPGDEVYFMGDFGFTKGDATRETERLVSRMNGQFHWIFGNHDKREAKRANGFAWKGNDKVIKIGEHKIHLYHFPIRQWDCKHYGALHLYGHVHHPDFDIPEERSLNVCIDCNNYRTGKYRPMEFEEILAVLRKKNCTFPDWAHGKIPKL